MTDDELRALDAYWRAANYLAVGQIYLLDNPLLREPLRPEHVKPRLLGHWGTTPGLNFLYTHLDRAIRERAPRRDLRLRARATAGRRSWRRRTSRGRTASSIPHVVAGRGGATRVVPAVLVPGRHPEPRGARDTRLDPRGRRAWLRTLARLRRGLRRSGSAPSPASSATGRPRPGPSRRAGTRTSSRTPQATAASCRSCTSTATRSPTRPCSPGSRRTSSTSLLRGYGYEPYSSSGTSPRRCTAWPRRSIERTRSRIQPSCPTEGVDAPALADDRPPHAQGLDRAARGRRPPGRGDLAIAPGARSPSVRTNAAAPERSSRTGCAATAPRSCSTRPGGTAPRARSSSRPRENAGWAPTRTPTAA